MAMKTLVALLLAGSLGAQFSNVGDACGPYPCTTFGSVPACWIGTDPVNAQPRLGSSCKVVLAPGILFPCGQPLAPTASLMFGSSSPGTVVPWQVTRTIDCVLHSSGEFVVTGSLVQSAYWEFGFSVPNDPALVGATIYMQGVHAFDDQGVRLLLSQGLAAQVMA
jgi:hypothetical protein